MVSIRQNIVSLFASSFSDEDHLYFFRVTLRCDLIAVPYLCLQWRRLRFGNGLQLMLLFPKIKYTVQKPYGGLRYKRFA